MKRRIVLPFLAVALSFLVSCNNDDDDVVEPDSPVDYPAEVQNDYPIVLAHGMCGWGRDEMNGFHYWEQVISRSISKSRDLQYLQHHTDHCPVTGTVLLSYIII